MSHTPKIPGINNGVTTIQTNVSTLQTDVSTLETDVSTLETDVSTLETDISTLQTGGGEGGSGSTETFTNTYSVDFDGSNDYISFANTLGIPSSTAASISCWINCSNTTASQQLFGTNNKVFSVELWGPTNVFYVEMGQSKFATLSNMRNYITQGSWHHIAVVYDGSGSTNADKIKLYIDGQLMTLSFTGTIDSAMPSFSNFYFGKGFYNVYYRGLLDECALWNSTALSSSDVSSIYNSGTPNDISSLNPVGWWRMGDNDSGTGTTITDQGSGGNNGTLINGPTFSTDIAEEAVVEAFSNTYSLNFDGTNDYVNAGSIDSALSATAFSYSVWFKLDSTRTDFHSIIAQDNNYTTPNTTRGFFLLFDNRSSTNSNRISASVYGSGSAVYKDLRFNELDTPDNNWHHFVFTCDVANDTYQAYLDGSSITPSFSQNGSGGAPSSMYQNNLDLYIGSRQSSGRPFKGNIDEVALFNSILSSSEASSLYNSGTPADISSLSPVGWWRMGDNDSGTGTTITDQGSGGNDGTLTNNPTFSTDVPEFTNNYSLSLDGTDDYVSVTQDSAINISGDITLSAWIYRTKTTSYNAIFTKRQVGGSMNYQFTINNSNGRIGLGHSGNSWVYNTTTTLATGTWYHVAVTVSSGTAQFYVNGVSEDSFTGISINATTQDLIIGATLGYNYFDGNIDEAAIFNSALSSSDITSIYNSGTPGNISSLNPVGWWRMGDNDSGTGTTITDQGSGGNNGTLINGPTFSTDIAEEAVAEAFSNTYSLSLDGTDDYLYFGSTAPGTALSLGTTDLAISIWFKNTSLTSQDFLFQGGSGRVFTTSSGQLTIKGSAYTSSTVTISGALTANTWHHLVIERTNGTQKIYLDNILKNTQTTSGGFAIEQFGYFATAGYNWEGGIDEISIHSGGLSASDVSAIYNGGTPIDLTGLYNITGWWRMGDNDSGTGTTVTDQGSGGNNLTLINGPTFSTSIPS